MNACPACRRPVATARPTCLYCGAILPAASVAAAEAAARALAAADARTEAVSARGGVLEPGAGESAAPPLTLLVVDVTGKDARALSALLGLPAFEARLRARASGLHLHRAGPDEEIATEALRLKEAGLQVLTFPDAEARLAPIVATGGEPEGSGLRLRTTAGPVAVAAADVMLVVLGPIQREYQAREVERKKPRTATLEAGYRFHLHRRRDPRPVELDPASFTFGTRGALAGSSLLEMKAWIAALGDVPVDDAFRRLSVALSPAAAEDHAAASLRRTGPGLGRSKGTVPILDNLAQFRFWSGWRAAAFRRLQGPVLPSSRP
jgi:hypothetical protein